MSVNSSSFSDISHLPLTLFSFDSFHPLLNTCYTSEMAIYVFSTISIAYILLLPLPVLVLYLGFQQRRKQRSISTSASDLFVHHSIIMQMAEILGFIVFFCGGYITLPQMMTVGLCVWSLASLGHTLCHLLTCVERYLAVVHPITYLSLRQTRGVRIRTISIGCVWLLSFSWLTLYFLCSEVVNLISYFCIMALFLVVISFFSVSVLCALKRPGPGEVGGTRESVDQSKQRAFHTIMAIMVIILLRVMGNLLYNVIDVSFVHIDTCVLTLSTMWFSLPSRLVLPLLFLHREGKLKCCK